MIGQAESALDDGENVGTARVNRPLSDCVHSQTVRREKRADRGLDVSTQRRGQPRAEKHAEAAVLVFGSPRQQVGVLVDGHHHTVDDGQGADRVGGLPHDDGAGCIREERMGHHLLGISNRERAHENAGHLTRQE